MIHILPYKMSLKLLVKILLPDMDLNIVYKLCKRIIIPLIVI